MMAGVARSATAVKQAHDRAVRQEDVSRAESARVEAL